MARRWRTLIGILFLALLAVPVAHHKAHAEGKQMTRTISVSATGTVTAEPDIVRIQAGITTEAETAKAALKDNNAVMRQLFDALSGAGIDGKDIQTSNFNVAPRYDHSKRGGSPRITGYQVTNQVSIKLREVNRSGEILDMLVQHGANQMSGISFEVSKADALKDEARVEAIKSARRKAELLASAADAKLGPVMAIEEDAPSFQPRPMAMNRAQFSDASSVPVAAGAQDLASRVTVTWQLID